MGIGIKIAIAAILFSVVSGGYTGAFLTSIGRALTSSGIELERGLPTFISASGL